MLTDDQREHIRRAYHLDGKSLRQIARDLGISRDTVAIAVAPTPFVSAQSTRARPWPVLGPYQTRINALFQLCSELHERVSMVVTTNLRFGEWNTIFGNERMTAAFLDRLTYKSHILEFVGDSYRFRQRMQQEENASAQQSS